jgi:hypothetical protein
MQKKRILVAFAFALALCLHAASPPRGADRLRELVVFPEIDFNFSWGINCQNNEWVITQNVDLPSAIVEQREKLERQPDGVQQPQSAIDWINQVLKYFPNDETAIEISKNLRANSA